MPDGGGDVTITYYIIADNTATWRGSRAARRGLQYHDYTSTAAPSRNRKLATLWLLLGQARTLQRAHDDRASTCRRPT
jgi:hypothetical protein